MCQMKKSYMEGERNLLLKLNMIRMMLRCHNIGDDSPEKLLRWTIEQTVQYASKTKITNIISELQSVVYDRF